MKKVTITPTMKNMDSVPLPITCMLLSFKLNQPEANDTTTAFT